MSKSAFIKCPDCDGRGFLRKGDFANRSFPLCQTCKGLGQSYLEPVTPPPVGKTFNV